MQLIKVRFLKGEVVSGRSYTYITPEPVEVGDVVQINSMSKGIVTETGITESEVEGFRDKLKAIVGKVVEEQEPVLKEISEDDEKCLDELKEEK